MKTSTHAKAPVTQKPMIAPNQVKPVIPDNNKAYRIFYVDDDLMMRKLLQRTLSAYDDFDLHGFSTGEDCISELSSLPDIIVLDYHLSLYDEEAMNGLEVLKIIRERNPDIKVIMLSSQNEVSVAVDCLKRGAVDYVIKDNCMKVNLNKSIERVVHSMELKKEIMKLSETVKRDKLLIRGYSAIILLFAFAMIYLLFLK